SLTLTQSTSAPAASPTIKMASPLVTPAATPFTGIVGTFFDTDPNPADYSAIIAWGDGTASAGIVSAQGNDLFNVLGTHPAAPNVNNPLFVSVTNVTDGDQLLAAQPAALPFSDGFSGFQMDGSWATESGSFIIASEAFAGTSGVTNVAVLKGVSAANISESAGVSGLLPGDTTALIAR